MILYIVALITLTFPVTLTAGLSVVTTTEDIAAITRAVSGNKFKVTSLTKGTKDPHFAAAKPSMIRHVNRADLLISIGADLELAWLPAVIRSARNSNILPGENGYLDLSSNIHLLDKQIAPVTRDQGDVHAAGNPHYWLDPDNGLIMAEKIAARLILLDSGNKQLYSENLQIFRQTMRQKIKHWKSQLEFLKGQKLIAYHSSLNYLANAFGFTIADFIEPIPGIAPSVSHVNQLINKIQHQDIQYLIMEPYYEKRSARLLKRKTGIKLLVIPQSVGAKAEINSYEKLFDAIVEVIFAAQ